MDREKAAKAMAAPAQRGRSRADRGDNPRPPGQTDQQAPPPAAASVATETKPEPTPIKPPAPEKPAQTAPAAAAAPETVTTPVAPEPKVDAAPAVSPKRTESSSPKPVETKTQPPGSSPSKPAGPVDAARTRLKARTAEQTFLPLVSRIAKLNDWIGQARMAVTDAKAAGVPAEHLEDTLRGIARKNAITYTDIPESVRTAIAAD